MSYRPLFSSLILLLLLLELLLPILKYFSFGPVAVWSWGMVTAPLWAPWFLCFTCALASARGLLRAARL